MLTAQNLAPKVIDSLSKVSWGEVKNNNYVAFIKTQKYLLKESQKINYSKGISKAYFNIGISNKMVGDFSEAIKAFNNFKKCQYSKVRYDMLAEAERHIGDCYYQQNLFENAIDKFRSAIRIGKNSKKMENVINAINYNNIAGAIDGKSGDKDSVYHYITKAYYYINLAKDQIPDSDKYTLKSSIAINLGDIWNERKNQDSAAYYYTKALDYNKINDNVGTTMIINHHIGNFYLNNKKYKIAEEKFLVSIKLSSESKNIYVLRDNYKSILQLYKETENKKEYQKYSELYIKVNDIITLLEIKSKKASVDNIIQDKNEIFQQKTTKLYLIIGSILLLIILIALYVNYFHTKVKNGQNDIINSSKIQLENKRAIIEEKEQETERLKSMLNVAFDDVINLAKENSAHFFTRFQEVYPAFCENLLQINPNLVSSELKFCAYIFLNFSTKDIALYTFTSPKTVQNRKNSIRKKLNILSNEDIYKWIKNV